MGMPVRVRWHGPLPEPCIVVANHCSYLDGVVLAAILPPRFDFVIKREMSSVPLAGFLLQRIGVQFVTRDNRAGRLRDALRVMRSAAGGGSLAFFPEGTLHGAAGTAALSHRRLRRRAALRRADRAAGDTRHSPLPAPGSFLPRPGRITIETLAPMSALRPGDPTTAASLARCGARRHP